MSQQRVTHVITRQLSLQPQTPTSEKPHMCRPSWHGQAPSSEPGLHPPHDEKICPLPSVFHGHHWEFVKVTPGHHLAHTPVWFGGQCAKKACKFGLTCLWRWERVVATVRVTLDTSQMSHWPAGTLSPHPVSVGTQAGA